VTGSGNHLGQRVYRCRPADRQGPGPHVARLAAPADAYLAEVVVARLSLPDAAELLAPPARADVSALRAAAGELRRRMVNLGRDYGLGRIGRAAMHAGTEAAAVRLAAIDTDLAAAGRADVLAPIVAAESARAAWDGLDTSRRRAVVARLVTVTLHPAGRGARGFDPATVGIEWAS
jgi:hypothetical protein